MYYNTNKEKGEKLANSELKATKQEEIVLNFFEQHPKEVYSPDYLWELCFNKSVPLTSVRRAITNLAKVGNLEKTERMIMGCYGKIVHGWRRQKARTRLSLFDEIT